jgi:carbonic anhydrase/acetyltransferase-like protein (isoleucine patch superfamily)
LFEGWVDCEFVNFGKNVVVGQGSIVQSAVIIGNLIIIRKTIIDDDVRIGAHAVVMPGTHIGKRAVLAANSVTTVGQNLEDEWIYLGVPAKKYKKNRFFEDGLESLLEQMGPIEDVEGLRKKYEELYIKRHDTRHGLKELWEIRKEKKEEEKGKTEQ